VFFFTNERRYLPSILKMKEMKSILILMVIVSIVVASCNSADKIDRSDPLISGRGFIEASLKGDYIKAANYLLKDSTNMEYFEELKDFNSKMSNEDRSGYADANIIIDSSVNKSDSVDIIYYTNTYKNKPTKLKMVKQNKEWLVDFKYTFRNN
jgi:hypothetical protein